MAETTTEINYAEKYSSVIDERFKLGSLTGAAFNNNYEYDFDGVNKVNVYSVDTAPLVDYDLHASANRYGTPVELGNDKQEFILTQDKAFTFVIDKRNLNDTMMANSAGKALQREIDEVITPMLDKYNLSILATNAGTIAYEGISDKALFESPYNAFLNANLTLTENKVPLTGRIAFITPKFFKLIKRDRIFKNGSDEAYKATVNGQVGSVDGVPIIVVPSEYLPERANFLITHPSAAIAPKKITEYKTHDKPQGYSGWLCEGRLYFDTFVFKNKKMAIYYSAEPDPQDLTLTALTIGNKTLTPAFDSSVTEYTCTTSDATNTITATPYNNSTTVEIKHNNKPVENGTAVTWDEESNVIMVSIYFKHPDDGFAVSNTYIVRIQRES